MPRCSKSLFVICIAMLMLVFTAGCAKKQVRGQPQMPRSGVQGTKSTPPPPEDVRTPAPSAPSEPAGPVTTTVPAEPQEPVVRRGTQKVYSQFGKTYKPMITVGTFTQQGYASWYGKKFHGRKTASGEVYNMYDRTAAHRVLPMHTRLRVTNLENGKTTMVKVNDRGPFVDVDKRIIDLSYTAARELDMVQKGVMRVRIETVDSDNRLSNGDISGEFYVQVGSFSKQANALALARKLRSKGYPHTRLVSADVGGRSFWRVQAGAFNSLGAAEIGRNRLRQAYPKAFIIAR